MKGFDFFEHMATKPPFSKLEPAVAAFFKDYMANEKVITYNDRHVINTHFPPYPSPAFDNLVSQFGLIGGTSVRRLYSVTMAVTNRCMYNCWHCYNAGRNPKDIPLPDVKRVITEMQEMYAVRVTLSGGEPLLRDDLEEIAGYFDDRTFLNLNTTGYGLTPERAGALKDSGIFAVGISIDSKNPDQHDQLRGRQGAFSTALDALTTASDNGLYPYIVTVASHDMLLHDNFYEFMKFAGESGALEVHMLEPCATGKLTGKNEALLSEDERRIILDYQKEISDDDSLPILSSFLYLESPEAFGCGAGITHLYIDGSGEVCPCNFVPVSFGNISEEPLKDILDKMGCHFCNPRTECVGHTLSPHIHDTNLPTPIAQSKKICEHHLPEKHDIPRFFAIKSNPQQEVGKDELSAVYNRVHSYYDEFWVTEAGRPVEDLVAALSLNGNEAVFEAGCGTGFATVLIAEKLNDPSRITAADISGGMISQAKERAASKGIDSICFIEGDALKIMLISETYDIIFSSWVLGYIPLEPFFSAAARALSTGGRLAFIVHKENSPRIPLEIFGEIVAKDPSLLTKSIHFDFPKDANLIETEILAAGLEITHLAESEIVFGYETPEKVLEHLLKSGAGTVFYEAIDPTRREKQEKLFIEILRNRYSGIGKYDVVHDYISCIAQKA
ncbi:radical SAM protein [Candidatus Latescibacterota bacterium]